MITDPVREKLKRLLEWKGWSYREAARQLECDESYPGKIIAGSRDPGLDLAFRIEELSLDFPEGPISAREWTSLALIASTSTVDEHASTVDDPTHTQQVRS